MEVNDHTTVNSKRRPKRNANTSQVSSGDSAVSSATPTSSSETFGSLPDTKCRNQTPGNVLEKISNGVNYHIINSPYLQPIISIKNSSLTYNKQLQNIYNSLLPTRKSQKKLLRNLASPSKKTRINAQLSNAVCTSERKLLNKALHCEITLEFIGRLASSSLRRHILIYQQHCGGNPIMVYQGYLHQGDIFSFTSKRQPSFPFSITLYIDGILNQRLTACCEYKHHLGHKLGGSKGQFVLKSVTGSFPCYKCQLASNEKMKSSKSEQCQQPESELPHSSDVGKSSDLEDDDDDKSDYEADFEDDEPSSSDEVNIGSNTGQDIASSDDTLPCQVQSDNPRNCDNEHHVESRAEPNVAVDHENTMEKNTTGSNREETLPLPEPIETEQNLCQNHSESNSTDEDNSLVANTCEEQQAGDKKENENPSVSQNASDDSPSEKTETQNPTFSSAKGDSTTDETEATYSSPSSDTDDDVMYHVDDKDQESYLNTRTLHGSSKRDEWIVVENQDCNKMQQWKSYRDEQLQFDSSEEDDAECIQPPRLTVTADVHVSEHEPHKIF